MKTLTNEERLVIKVAKSVTEHDIELSVEDFQNIDWSILMNILKSQKIYMLLFNKISKYMPKEVYFQYAEIYEARKSRVDSFIAIAQKLSAMFEFKHCIVKGFVLSQILYDNPYDRDFNDNDFFMEEKNIVEAAFILENSLFTERNLLELEEYMQLPRFSKELFYNIDFEKQFVNKEGLRVEIKSFASKEYEKSDVLIALQSTNDVTINGFVFNTLNFRETFIYLLTNTYTNFISDWGINHDFRIRDIIDFKQFIDRYHKMFDDNFLFYIKERGKFNMLLLVLLIIEKFYEKESVLSYLLANNSYVDELELIYNNYSIFNLIYNREERRNRYCNYLSHNSVKNNAFQEINAVNLVNLKYYDHENGNVQAQFPIWPNNTTIINATGGMILSGIDYNKDYFFINIKIPNTYPELCTKIQIKGKDNNEYIIFAITTTSILKKDSSIQGYKIIFNSFEHYKVITIQIPRSKEYEFTDRQNTYYYVCYDMCIGSEYKPLKQKIAMWGSHNYFLRFNVD